MYFYHNRSYFMPELKKARQNKIRYKTHGSVEMLDCNIGHFYKLETIFSQPSY